MADVTGGLLQTDQRAAGDARSAGQWMRDAQAQQAGGVPVFGGALNPGGQAPPPPPATLPHSGSMPSAQLAALVQAAGHSPDARAQKAAQVGAMLHVLGTLARKPDLTSRDVMDAATTAIKSGHTDADQAADFIVKLPPDSDPAKLRAAIQQKFADAILASIHLAPQPGAPGAAR